MAIKTYGKTHTGMVRGSNEDAYGVYPNLSLFIVADGLGGHAGGEVASRMAVDIIKEGITSAYNRTSDIRKFIIEAIEGANTRIFQAGRRESHLRDMGTTVVVVKIEDEKAIVAHVGDSRAYLIRGDVLSRITKDHTIVEEYMRAGLLSSEDALSHPYRHVLSRALGVSEAVDIDASDIQLQRGDTIILCTDGLTNMVTDKEILQTALEMGPSPEKITERLIHLANENGGIDNITIITLCRVE